MVWPNRARFRPTHGPTTSTNSGPMTARPRSRTDQGRALTSRPRGSADQHHEGHQVGPGEGAQAEGQAHQGGVGGVGAAPEADGGEEEEGGDGDHRGLGARRWPG